jgi:hypothetical protein
MLSSGVGCRQISAVVGGTAAVCCSCFGMVDMVVV